MIQLDASNNCEKILQPLLDTVTIEQYNVLLKNCITDLMVKQSVNN